MAPAAHMSLVSDSEGPPAPAPALVRAAQQGDRAAQQAVFEALYPVVRKHLTFQLGSAHEALEEAVQETMVSIFRHLAGFRGDAKITTWALTVAIREARRQSRRWRRHQMDHVDEGIAGFSPAPPSATAAQVTTLLGELKPKKREAFLLMELFELTAVEAGEVLGVSANTAASRCRHARQELLQKMNRPTP